MMKPRLSFVALFFISLIARSMCATPTIWFTKEPGNYYFIDSFNDEATPREQQILVDCAADKTFSARRSKNISVHWLRDGIFLENKQHSDLKGDSIYQEVLTNGSLLLRAIPGSGKYNQTDSELETLSSIQCVADDSFGRIISRPAKLVRVRMDSFLANQFANKFIRQPENATLASGKRLILKCKPNITQLLVQNGNNQYPVNYQWFKNAKLLPLNSRTILYRDGTLEISQAGEIDSGTYKCLVKYRNFLFESRQAFVKVLSEPTTTTTPTTFVSTTATEPARLTTPSFYLWPEDKSIQEGDEAVFECLASNDLSFGYSPAFFAANEYVYKWLKDGLVLNATSVPGRLKLVQGHNLKIDAVQESDFGTYTCQICRAAAASNNRPSDSSECDERSGVLKVLVPPRFVKRPSSLNATLKSDVEFECHAYGVPAPKVQWFKNGEPIYPSEYFQFSPNQGDLKILGIIAQDEGYYQCLASNELNTIQSIAQLVVLKGANYDYDDYGTDGQDDYRSSEFDFAKSVKLKKATSMTPAALSKETSSSSSLSKNSLFNKPKLQAAPSTSTVSSVIELSAPVNLRLVKAKSRSIQIEWHPPAIIRSSDPRLQRSSDALTYSVNWKAKNMERQRELNTTKTSALIDELTPDTTYQINVFAVLAATKSPDASIEIKTELEARVPGAPLDFKASFSDPLATSAPAIRFRWRRPAVNAHSIVKYRLYYKHMSYGPYTPELVDASSIEGGEYSEAFDPMLGDQMDPIDVPAAHKSALSEKFIDIDSPGDGFDDAFGNEFILEDVLKYSTYRFRLVALDRELLGQLTNETGSANLNYAELLVETPSDVPDGPPETVQLETINTTAISVQWQPPLLEKCNGVILGYQITVKGAKHLNLSAEREPTYKVISGLAAGQKYSVRMTAKTANGSGPWSEWVFGETFARDLDESRAPGQPLELHVEPTDKSIVIHWVPPADSGKVLVRKYLLKYGIGFPDSEVVIAGNLNSYIVNNLIPSSQYVLSLRALNNAGTGMEILKDVFTKRKSVLGENDLLFPPLNVQAVAISTQSIELRWTDWHLKPEENIPDDRHYSVRYSVADQAKYKYKNATERNVIVSDLSANTLYDFSVRLVIGQRKSDWSMTTSQMTMESSPTPRILDVRSDPGSPSTVILSWQAPNYASTANTGYSISYMEESTARTRQKWRQETVSSQQLNGKQTLSASIHNLKLNTTYYFKVQAKNSRTYGAFSGMVMFVTPAGKGQNGRKIWVEDENNQESSVEATTLASAKAPAEAAAKKENGQNSTELMSSVTAKAPFELNMMWIVTGSVSSLVVLVIIFCAICIRKRSSGKQKASELKISQQKRGSSASRSYDNCGKSNGPRGANMEIMENEDEDADSAYHQKIHGQQQQKLLTCNTNFQQEWAGNGGAMMNQQQQHTSASRTPSHLAHHHGHHGQPLLINNPNHMMMTLISNNSNPHTQFHTHIDASAEFYSTAAATNQPLLTNNSHSETIGTFTTEAAYLHQQQEHDRFSQSGTGNDLSSEITNTTAAIAAANAAFNAPFANTNLIQAVNGVGQAGQCGAEQSMFMRHTIRPKPIAIPLNTTTSTTMSTSPSPLANSSLNANSTGIEHHGMFSTSAAHRKSFKNLPIATATLIPSNAAANAASNQHINFGESLIKQSANNGYFGQQSNVQKLHYTARPYIIDNQVQSNYSGNGEYSNHHSPASSHSSSQPPVYDKIGNVVINANGTSMAPSSVSTKSLLQPLKSFGNSQQVNTVNPSVVNMPPPPSSMSIPNTPAKYCESLSNNFVNMTRSPAKKIVTNANNRGPGAGKSVENIFEKKQPTMTTPGGGNNEELTVEMANLEGIMKDLNAITAQQFEC